MDVMSPIGSKMGHQTHNKNTFFDIPTYLSLGLSPRRCVFFFIVFSRRSVTPDTLVPTQPPFLPSTTYSQIHRQYRTSAVVVRVRLGFLFFSWTAAVVAAGLQRAVIFVNHSPSFLPSCVQFCHPDNRSILGLWVHHASRLLPGAGVGGNNSS